jgi:hypothetical protein
MESQSTFAAGIAPEHYAAFWAAILLPAAAWLALRWLRGSAARGGRRSADFISRYAAAPFALRLTAGLLLLTGVIHLALPFGHEGAPVLNLMFLAAGAAFVKLSYDALGEKRWRRNAALLLAGSIAGYLMLTGSGWQEEPDQVGIATKLVELLALGLIMVPAFSPEKGLRRRLARPLASTAFVALTVVTGTVIWVGSFVAHGNTEAVAAHEHEPGTEVHSHDSGHSHTFAARAQAGVIMRPASDQPPTVEQLEAAARFAAATKAGLAKYEDVNAAIADGYRVEGPALGVERHFGNKEYKKDGRITDATRPEMLVYGTKDGRFLLLGAVYVMEKAGEPGVDIGGPVARWHAHNICATPLPPAFGLVSPFGTCPLASVNVTIPEMIHVWTIDNPDGPYAHELDDKWVAEQLDAMHYGRPSPHAERRARGALRLCVMRHALCVRTCSTRSSGRGASS